jgi:hypothetical protein
MDFDDKIEEEEMIADFTVEEALMENEEEFKIIEEDMLKKR